MKILFTTNIFDNVDAYKEMTKDGLVTYGGYSRLKTVIDEKRDDNTLLLDTGNFSMGTIYSVINTKKAPDLALMNTLGYDAILLGDQEVSRGDEELSTMLSILEANPPLLKGNMNYSDDGTHNVNEYYIYEKGGRKVAIFGIVSTANLDDSTKAYFSSEEETTQRYLTKIKNERADFIICLYCGNASGATNIANNNHDIDLIICADMENETEISASGVKIIGCSNKGKELGIVEIDTNGKVNASTVLIDESIEANEEITNQIKTYQKDVQQTVLTRYGLSFQNVFAQNKYNLSKPNMEKENFALADLITDAYRNAYVYRDDDKVKTTISITDGDSIKNGLYSGGVSINEIFSLVSSEKGEDDLPGLSLIRVYLSGSDLRNICELDASKLKDIEDKRLFFGGMKYDYNNNRPLWNKVEEVYVSATKDYFIPISDDVIYPVVMNTKIYEKLGKELAGCEEHYKWSPKGIKKEENPELRTILLRNNDGTLIKEWSSIAAYIKKGERDNSGKYIINKNYASPIMKKKNNDTLNPINLLKNIKKEEIVSIGKKAGYVIGALILLKIFIYIINRLFKKEKTDN